MRVALSLATILALGAAGAALGAPQVAPSAPREETGVVLAGKRLAVTYGRPALGGRTMFGVMIPYGQVWRAGADEATKLTTEIDLRIAGLAVPKGAYALFVIPGERDWQLVLNKTADQWGAFNYDARQDVGRVAMRLETLAAPLERLSMALTASGETTGTLWIGWEKNVASVDFEVVPDPAPPAAPPPAQ